MRVSGLITCFNQQRYILEAVDSLINQVDELIVIDDQSTDHSWNLLEKNFKQFSKVKLLQNPRNSGVSFTLQKGIRASTSDLILIQGGDDVSLPHRRDVEEDKILSHPNALISSSKPLIIDEHGNQIIGTYADNSFDNNEGLTNYAKKLFFQGNSICAPSVTLQKKFLKKIDYFPLNLDHVQDYITWIEMSLHGDFYFSAEPVVKYRIHSNNISRYIEDPNHYLNRIRAYEIAFALNRLILKFDTSETELFASRLGLNFNQTLSLDLNKIQILRIFPNSFIQQFCLHNCYNLVNIENDYEKKLIRELLDYLSYKI